MGAETVGTLVAVALVVGAIAVALIGVTLKLLRADAALRRIHAGVLSIGGRTQPVGGLLGEVAAETRTIGEALTALVALATGPAGGEILSMSEAVAEARARPHTPVAEAPAPPPPSTREEVAGRAKRPAQERGATGRPMHEAVARAREAVASGGR